MAARTRSRASRTALSAKPTTVNAGRPSRMSASTQTRRAFTPSTAKVVTRESISGRLRRPRGGERSASERGLQVVEPDEGAAAVEQDADAVEAQPRAERAVRRLGQPGERDPPDLRALALVQVGERLAGAGEAGLDLGEDERLA